MPRAQNQVIVSIRQCTRRITTNNVTIGAADVDAQNLDEHLVLELQNWLQCIDQPDATGAWMGCDGTQAPSESLRITSWIPSRTCWRTRQLLPSTL